MKNSYELLENEAHIFFRKATGFFVVDKEDLNKISQFTWYKDSWGYPATYKDGEHLRCHQVVMGKASKGLVTDHINRNKLDNRKNNLRFVTPRENSINRDVVRDEMYGILPREGIKGTTYRVTIHGKTNKTIHIGSYKTLEKAVSVRDIAFDLCQKGELTPFEIEKLRKSRA